MKQKIKITREQARDLFIKHVAVKKGPTKDFDGDDWISVGETYIEFVFPDSIEIEVDVPEKDNFEKARDAHDELMGRWEKFQTQKAMEKLAWEEHSKQVNDDFSNLAAVLQIKINDQIADAIIPLEKRIAALEAKNNFVFLREDQVKDGPLPGPFGWEVKSQNDTF